MRIAALGRLAGPTFGEGGLGALTATAQANVDQLTSAIANRLEAYNALVYRIERDGFSSELLLTATSELRGLEGRWGSLAEDVGALDERTLPLWLEQADRLRSDIELALRGLQQRITAATPARTAGITLKTVAVVGGIFALVYGGYWWSTKYRRYRYGEGRRYVRATTRRTRRRA